VSSQPGTAHRRTPLARRLKINRACAVSQLHGTITRRVAACSQYRRRVRLSDERRQSGAKLAVISSRGSSRKVVQTNLSLFAASSWQRWRKRWSCKRMTVCVRLEDCLRTSSKLYSSTVTTRHPRLHASAASRSIYIHFAPGVNIMLLL